MTTLCLQDLSSNVIDMRSRKPFTPPKSDGYTFADELHIRDEVKKTCRALGLNDFETGDSLITARGTLAFCMPLDRAIAAGRQRAHEHARRRAMRNGNDDDGPRAA